MDRGFRLLLAFAALLAILFVAECRAVSAPDHRPVSSVAHEAG
jgi:hypothetical protein